MSYGSYYQSSPNYYQNPVPYTSGDYGEPVPGWGTSVSVAGPAKVGVGADFLIPGGDKPSIDPSLLQKFSLTRQAAQQMVSGSAPTTTTSFAPTSDQSAPAASGEPLPWWIFPAAAAVVLGGVGYIGVKKGWF